MRRILVTIVRQHEGHLHSGLPHPHIRHLHDIIQERGRHTFEELEKIHERLECFSSSSGEWFRRVRNTLEWDPKDIDEFKSRITTDITLLNVFLSLKTNSELNRVANEVAEGVAKEVANGVIIDW